MIRLARPKPVKVNRFERGKTHGGGSAGPLDKGELLAALRAFKRGDFEVRLPDGLDGIDGQICEVLNDVLQGAEDLRQESLQLARSVSDEGRTLRRLGEYGARGGWLDVTRSVNTVLDHLTDHTQQVVRVVAAVSRGDLSQAIDVEAAAHPLRGDFLSSARTVNGMVQQLATFGSQVTHVAHEVGVMGKLGAQARVEGVSGAWKEVTDAVNRMASNLTTQVREIARVTTAVAQGDLTKTISIEVQGEILELKNTINTMVDQLGLFTDEVTRVSREVGTEGVLGGQAQVRGVSGVWRELTENVNSMAQNLTDQVRNIAEVSAAIAAGDLSKKITVEVQGEILELKNTINTMVDQLSAFADEVTRVSREVGTDGILGGQAKVGGASGVWRELTENVNFMANNLTDQVRNIAEVVTAIAEGDLSRKITVDARGEILALKDTINSTVDKLSRFSAEVTRVARLVGTEGTLGVQAEVRDVSGVWRELTENVNLMGRNLTDQVRDIAGVTTAVANGDLSRKITVEVKGEILTLKNTINAMVDSLSSFADEVTRMAREVGTEGVLGGQAVVHGASGIWKELTLNVNSMASNLTNQVRNIAGVARAVAQGDLSRKITVNARGEVLDLKNTINDMVDQLNAFGAEVTRVAREVGVEGKLGGQAEVDGVRGIWSELTENVNLMASNLTNQVRDIAGVTTAVARGDLTRKIQVDARGEILELKNTVNTMVDQLGAFAEQVTRLASDVGIEGKLGGQADVAGVSGTWRDLTDAVNSMADNLTTQVRNIAQVATAIAQGDLKEKIVVDARGEILELKNTINTMVDQLSAFAEQVTLVAREVGTEGKLGGQAAVEGVRGTWKELTDNVNLMASNLTAQVRDVSRVSSAIARGDLGRKVTVEVRGEFLDLKNTINTMVDQLSSFADQVARVARDVGVEGKLGGQAEVRDVSGIWKELTDNVNLMASNLTNQVRDIATVTTAVANGDLSRKITVEVRGEILELKNTINTMVDQLSSFADEVTRVAREVGTDGILGGLAEVRGVSGTWRELTDNVNVMALNLTEQVRGIATVVTAVANGDLKQQLTLEAKGEIATLVETINNMIVTLSTFADQVTSVARDVGVEGKLGGQADVPGAAGIWRDLTNNVNELAGNLTRQVRAIGDVATAVTKGDLTQSITVEARGEVALLKDNLNQMIVTLAETTRVNEEQDWLKTNLARFTRMLQGQRALISVAEQVLSELAPVMDAQYGAFYISEKETATTVLKLTASYARAGNDEVVSRFEFGEGLVGQVAVERKALLLSQLPEDYVRVTSALGEASPKCLVVAPILFEGEVKGAIELAGFKHFSPIQLAFLEQLIDSLGIVLATIEATMRTDSLLRQSQGLTEELQTQQEALQQKNEELEENARQLTEQKAEVEKKNREVERAKQELEEKAEQLALTSRYKSQFLANMSHELRTPLNSLLILSRQLAENRNENLSLQQVEYARTIHHSGADLLSLINEILDLAKIESGTIALDVHPVSLTDVRDFAESGFRQVADEKGLAFGIEMSPELPEWLNTDDMRLKQVLRNLLANALKFTETGSVKLLITPVHADDFGPESPALKDADQVIAFSIVDTGIGIAKDKQKIVFEAFQQADGGTSRKFGGTGLGLSISREIAALLGGELHLSSEFGKGSVFTLYLPSTFVQDVDRVDAPAQKSTSSKRSTMPANLAAPARVHDDRTQLDSRCPVLLMIEDDDHFARDLLTVAREQGFQGVVALNGVDGLELSRRLKPDAITLDPGLPDMDGWVVLDQLKHDPTTRHIPVHMISASNEERRARSQGAIAFLRKPAKVDVLAESLKWLLTYLQRDTKNLLLVESDADEGRRLRELIGNSDVTTTEVGSVAEAIEALDRMEVDCLAICEHTGQFIATEVVRAGAARNRLQNVPIVICQSERTTSQQEAALKLLGRSHLITVVRSHAELLERTSLFLHRAPTFARAWGEQGMVSSHADSTLAGKKALIVDDDLRNVFALTALLEQCQVRVSYAENGHEALKRLDEETDIDVVLMDIMMPEMDGYEATRRIRQQARFAKLPVIALTAKAMKGDREKCISAGTSDYITKPIDSDQLLSLLRVWLYDRRTDESR